MPCTEPNCKHPHETEMDLDDLKAKLEVSQPKQAEVHVHTTTPANATVDVKHEDTTKDPHEAVRRNMPKGINYTQCKGCDTKIKNPRFNTKHKTCTNCGANTVPKDSPICTTCGKEPEEWEESEVNLEVEEEQE